MKNFNNKFQTQLLSVSRPMRKVLKKWLTPDELKLSYANQILVYFEKASNPVIQARVLKKLSVEAAALLKNIAARKTNISAGEALILTCSQGFNVSLSSLSELHFLGFVFLEDPDFWPTGKNDWSDEHSLQKLVLIPDIGSEQINVKRTGFDLPELTGKAGIFTDNNFPKLENELNDFLNLVSRKEIKLTGQNKFTARTCRIIDGKRETQRGNFVFRPEKLLLFFKKSNVIMIDSNKVVVPGKNFLNFRKEQPAGQLKLFLNYLIKEDNKFSASFDYSLLFLKILIALLRENRENKWLYFNKVISLMQEKSKMIFSVQKGHKSWNWKGSLKNAPSRNSIKKTAQKFIETYFLSFAAIELGKTESNSLCFRLTDFGKYWIQDNFMPAYEGADHKLAIMPDFTALLTGSGPLDKVSQTLGFFGKREGDYNASVFRFSRECVQAAVHHGHPVTELLEVLRENCSYPVPENVIKTFLDWGSASVKTELFCDVNLFSFKDESERESYARKFSHKPEYIGERFAIVREPENTVLNIMKNINAFPVDYSLSPVKPLEIKMDGEVICGDNYDLRIISVCNNISETKNGKYYLSEKVMKNNPFPKITYERFLKLSSDKTSLNSKINILIGLGLIDEQPDNEYYIIDNLTPKIKRELKKLFNLRQVLLAPVSKSAFVIDKSFRDLIDENISKTETKLILIKLQKII